MPRLASFISGGDSRVHRGLFLNALGDIHGGQESLENVFRVQAFILNQKLPACESLRNLGDSFDRAPFLTALSLWNLATLATELAKHRIAYVR